MKVHLLEFKLENMLFGIKTDIVKLIFDIEYIQETFMMPEYVIGLTSYGSKTYPLVCLQKLLDLNPDSCQNPVGKTAIVVKTENSTFAFPVDEVIKIQEIEKKEEDGIINFYKERDTVLEEITENFLTKKIKIQSFLENKQISHFTKTSTDYQTFTIFKVADSLYAVPSQIVKKVEDISEIQPTVLPENSWLNLIFSFKDRIIKGGSFRKFLGLKDSKPNDLIIFEEKGKQIGIAVDTVIDFIDVSDKEISTNPHQDEKFSQFFIYRSNTVSVLSTDFIKKLVENDGLITDETDQSISQLSDTLEFLTIKIGSKKFALDMRDILEIMEYSEATISEYPTTNPCVKGLTVFRDRTFFLLSYEPILKEKIKYDENTKIVFLKTNYGEIAIIISEIENILSLTEDKVSYTSDTENSFIKGVILNKKEIIQILNPNFMINQSKIRRSLTANADQ